MGRGKYLAYALITALSMSACSSKKIRPPRKSPMAESIKKKPVAKKNPEKQILNAKWSRGNCSLDANKMELTYTTPEESKTIKLDVEMFDIDFIPKELICSPGFTVAIGGDQHLLVSIGSERMLLGLNMLGELNNELTAANSYYLDITNIRKEGLESVFIDGSTLVFVTKEKIWEIDMTSPQNIYKTKRIDSGIPDI